MTQVQRQRGSSPTRRRPAMPSLCTEALEPRWALTGGPSDVVASAGDGGVVVSWIDDPVVGDPAAYAVEGRRLRDASWAPMGRTTGATSLVVTGLDAATHYAFRVLREGAAEGARPSVPSRPVTTPVLPTCMASPRPDGTAMVEWDPSVAGTRDLRVEFRRLAESSWQVHDDPVGEASGSIVVDHLELGAHYTFRLTSIDGGTAPAVIYRAPRSGPLTADDRTDPGLHATPGQGLTALVGTPVTLTWTDPSAAGHVEGWCESRRPLEPFSGLFNYGRIAGPVYAEMGSGSATVAVPGDAHHIFRLRMIDAAGNVTFSRPTLPVFVPPQPSLAPYDVVATLADDGVEVTWKDDQGPGLGYAIDAYRLSEDDGDLEAKVRGFSSADHRVVLTGFEPGAHYVFYVTRGGGHQNHISRRSAPFTTPASPLPFSTTPLDDGTARITWDPLVAGSGALRVEVSDVRDLSPGTPTGFDPYRALSAGTFSAAVGSAIIDFRRDRPTVLGSLRDDALEGGKTYTFRLLGRSGIYTHRSPGITIDTRPTLGLAVVPGAGSATVTWSDPFVTSRPETVVEYKRLRDSRWREASAAVPTATGTATITGLEHGTHYVFRLRQRDGDRLVTVSRPTTAVTIPPAPPPV